MKAETEIFMWSISVHTCFLSCIWLCNLQLMCLKRKRYKEKYCLKNLPKENICFLICSWAKNRGELQKILSYILTSCWVRSVHEHFPHSSRCFYWQHIRKWWPRLWKVRFRRLGWKVVDLGHLDLSFWVFPTQSISKRRYTALRVRRL